MEKYPNGAGFRPEVEDVNVQEEVCGACGACGACGGYLMKRYTVGHQEILKCEDCGKVHDTDEYRENLTETSDLNNPANFI